MGVNVERPATVEVYQRSENMFHLTVEPPIAIHALREYLIAQEDVLLRDATVAGDLAFEIEGKRSFEDVLKGAATVVGYHAKNNK